MISEYHSITTGLTRYFLISFWNVSIWFLDSSLLSGFYRKGYKFNFIWVNWMLITFRFELQKSKRNLYLNREQNPVQIGEHFFLMHKHSRNSVMYLDGSGFSQNFTRRTAKASRYVELSLLTRTSHSSFFLQINIF